MNPRRDFDNLVTTNAAPLLCHTPSTFPYENALLVATDVYQSKSVIARHSGFQDGEARLASEAFPPIHLPFLPQRLRPASSSSHTTRLSQSYSRPSGTSHAQPSCEGASPCSQSASSIISRACTNQCSQAYTVLSPQFAIILALRKPLEKIGFRDDGYLWWAFGQKREKAKLKPICLGIPRFREAWEAAVECVF